MQLEPAAPCCGAAPLERQSPARWLHLELRAPAPHVKGGEDDLARPIGLHTGRPEDNSGSTMRTTADRIRQAISFEIISLVIVTPLFAWLFERSLGEMGVLAFLGATAATLWNYVYNFAFDHAMNRWRGSPRKSFPLRILHAVLFEATLLVILLPLFAWWLSVSIVTALVMDMSFAAFYMVYAFVFTWSYDTLYPPQELGRTAG